MRSIGLSLSLVAAFAVAVSVAEDESTSSDSGFKKAQKYAASRRPPKQPFIPDPDDIARMRADVYQNPIGKPDIEGFDIPQEKAAEVVKFFRDAEIDHNPYGDTYELGTIRVHMKGGGVFRYCWYWFAPREQFSFSYNGIRYKSKKTYNGKDTALVLDESIRDWHSRATKASSQR